MEHSKSDKTEPSIRLLNEIEILLTQTRLLELYLRQGQTTAAEESSRLHDHFEKRLAVLRAELDAKEQALAEIQAKFHEPEESLQNIICDLQAELEEKQRLLEGRDGELQNAEAELTALRERVSQLDAMKRQIEVTANEQVEGTRRAFDAELNGLRAALAEKERIVVDRTAAFEATERRLAIEMNLLRGQVVEMQASLDSSHAEAQRAQAEIITLQGQKNQAVLAQRQTESLLAAQAEQIRQRIRAELADLDAQLQSQESRSQELQANLESKINIFQLQLVEKQLLLDSRNNEIGDLKANVSALSQQIGQLELATRQTEAYAASETQRVRDAHDAELNALREERRLKNHALEEHQDIIKNLRERFAAQAEELKNERVQSQELLKHRESALDAATFEAASLGQRLAQLESSSQDERTVLMREAKRMREEFQAELSTLQTELQQKEWAIAQWQASMENLAQVHKDRIQKLEARLLEQQNLAKSRERELEKATAEAGTARERMAQLETAIQHAEASALARVEQTRQRYEAQLAALQMDLKQKTSALQEHTALNQRAEALEEELHRLQTEAQEKHLLLENRNEELVRVKLETDRLRERFSELEVSARSAETAAANESERMRTEFQAQLALLQAELSQKEWALQEQQAIADGLKQNANPWTENLQALRSDRQGQLESAEGFFLGETKMSDAQKERYDRIQNLVETIKSDPDASFPASGSPRWRIGLGRKRRWKA